MRVVRLIEDYVYKGTKYFPGSILKMGDIEAHKLTRAKKNVSGKDSRLKKAFKRKKFVNDKVVEEKFDIYYLKGQKAVYIL